MTTRIIALGFAVFFLGLVAVMASVTMFVREPLQILSPNVPVAFALQDDSATLQLQLRVDGGYGFEVMTSSDVGEGAPEIALAPVGSGGAPLTPEVHETAPGVYSANGQFYAPGRWEISVRHGALAESFAFILRE